MWQHAYLGSFEGCCIIGCRWSDIISAKRSSRLSQARNFLSRKGGVPQQITTGVRETLSKAIDEFIVEHSSHRRNPLTYLSAPLVMRASHLPRDLLSSSKALAAKKSRQQILLVAGCASRSSPTYSRTTTFSTTSTARTRGVTQKISRRRHATATPPPYSDNGNINTDSEDGTVFYTLTAFDEHWPFYHPRADRLAHAKYPVSPKCPPRGTLCTPVTTYKQFVGAHTHQP